MEIYFTPIQTVTSKRKWMRNRDPRLASFVNNHRITVSKTSLLRTIVALGVLFGNVDASKRADGCPAVCSCNKENVAFCNNKGLNITPIGFNSAVERLYLFNNNISSILPATFASTKNLKVLDISGNRLSDVALWDGIFSKLELLENLILQNNRITRINRGMFSGLSKLARLYLHENRIETIDSEAFDSLPNLIELKLRSNRIARFPKLHHNPKLLLLDLGDNRLTALRDMAFATVNVEQLMLQNNKLTDIRTSVFDDTSHLRHLDISNNRLTAVPKVIKSLTSLKNLNLSLNKMEERTIPADTFTNLISLKYLYLSGMGLKTLPARIIPRNDVILNDLDLTENDWECGCEMWWMPAYMRRFEAALTSPSEVVCSSSSKLRGRKIIKLTESDFQCSREELEVHNARTTSAPLTTSGGHKSFIDPCDVYICGHGGTCHVVNSRPRCRCRKGWSGSLCMQSLLTTTSTSATTTTRTTRRIDTPTPQRPKLLINSDSIAATEVEIFIPVTNRQLLLTISEMGRTSSAKEFNIVPESHLFTVQHLQPGRSYNVCIHMPIYGGRTSRRSLEPRRDTLCGNVTTKGTKITNTATAQQEITVVPSPKVTTKKVETSSKKETTRNVLLSEPGFDQHLHAVKANPHTVATETDAFNMLYPAIGAGIGAVIVIIVIVMLCICRRQKRLLKLKKGTNADYTPGAVTDNHNDVEMATVVHHHHHNHYNAGSLEESKPFSKSSENSPASTIQSGSNTPSNHKSKTSPSKTNNNHSKSSRSSSRSSGVSQSDTRQSSVQPYVPPSQNPIQKYDQQNAIPSGYNGYRGHESQPEPKRAPHRQISQRPQSQHPTDTQPLFTGNNTYYGANDSHLYPMMNAPSYNLPSSFTQTPHSIFQPIQSPNVLGTSPGDSAAAHRLTNSHGMPPPMACLSRNLMMESMPMYHEGVQMV